MKSPKKIKKQQPVVMYPRDIKRDRQEVAERVMVLVTAYLMDELDYDEDKIIELWQGISRYTEAIHDHTITLKRVKEIIQKCTGIKMLGWRK